ncbi:Nucleoporin [Wickerhamomyces ciferrii]|uniref:Nucleoporin n=1 Tax=Wickerhamomyces ciferrii (strain ATCC 14091 / BCRC 22168 / CBS 111 / JCM 3599 / NBRC 0793 / NRRL Y-1031 F-60-10) TaxID=1206466 RepID=K0KD40_WICCF|nr:Nucleoporin [Wickerhamomyces ciferrii]CCH43020.1 Nucleoporin [Wickerhamomyces ciferrii]
MTGRAAFSARKFATSNAGNRGSGSDLRNPTSSEGSKISENKFTNTATELTRNSKYVVSKLAASPLALFGSNTTDIKGQIDEHTGHGLLASDELIHIWKYDSPDSIPNTIQIPVIPPNNGFAPLAVLVSPAAGSSEPGLVSINSHTGYIRFYENVGEASSFGLLHHFKGIEFQLSLYDHESIQIAENVEPAGIILTTSTGRVILLSLRNSAGKPFISSSEIVHRQTGFFSTSLASYKHIVSINAAAILGHGERVMTTITRGGDFQVWSCARDGQSKQVYQNDLLPTLVDHVKDLYPAAVNSLEILDMTILPNFKDQDAFLVLTSFSNGSNETFYLLFTIRKDIDQLLIVSAYKLNTFTSPYNKQPRLYVPAPGTTGFILFDNSVVLSELVQKLDHTSSLKKRWEDIVTFKSDIGFIGAGPEDQVITDGSVSKLSSLNVIAARTGILKIDRLQTVEEPDENPIEEGSYLKSHVEQAIFYGGNTQNPIKFDFSDEINIDSQRIENDLLQVSEEILNSKSSYLPPRLSSLQDHLDLRKRNLEKLLRYTAFNFNDIIDDRVKFQLIASLEKATAAKNFHQVVSSYQFNEKLSNIINKSFSTGFDELLLHHLDQINSVVSDILKQTSKVTGLEIIAAEIAAGVYYSVLEAEKEYRYDLFNLDLSKSGLVEPWYTTDSIAVHIDEAFTKLIPVSKDASDTDTSKRLITLTEILFYNYQQKISWLEAQSPKTKAIKDTLSNDQNIYQARSGVWTKSLILVGAKTEALAIAETYNDLKSLVEISEDDRENTKDEELNHVLLRFDHYFHKFGYEFAQTLYNYYISSGKYQVLLLSFQQYAEFLQRFFTENDHGEISWIRDILDGDFAKASSVLYDVSQTNDESQGKRHLQLSIAKLGALAAIGDEGRNNHNDVLLDDIQQQLDYVEVQNIAITQLSEFMRSDSDPSAQIDSISREVLKPFYKDQQFTIIEDSFKRALGRLLSNKSLSVSELVDIFTLLSTNDDNKANHFYALKLLHLSNLSNDEKLLSEKLVWKRALLSDDWEHILNLTHKTDDFIKEKAEETVLFVTLEKLFQDKLYLPNAGYSVSLPNIDELLKDVDDQALLSRFKYIGGNEVFKLHQEFSHENEVIQNLRALGIEKWIKALIGTSHERSGALEVVNYNTLTIESNE